MSENGEGIPRWNKKELDRELEKVAEGAQKEYEKITPQSRLESFSESFWNELNLTLAEFPGIGLQSNGTTITEERTRGKERIGDNARFTFSIAINDDDPNRTIVEDRVKELMRMLRVKAPDDGIEIRQLDWYVDPADSNFLVGKIWFHLQPSIPEGVPENFE